MSGSMLKLDGVSVAGVETCIEVPSLRLVLDMGRCTRHAVNQPTVLVSHGHLDHAGALTQHATRRAMMNMSVPTYIVPKSIATDIEELFNAAGRLDGNPIARKIVPLDVGEEYSLTKTRVVKPFRTFHRVASQGYVVWDERKRLKPEFASLDGPQIAELRAKGEEVSTPHFVALLAFTGDTRVDVLEANEELRQAETLVIESSFLDEKVTVEQAREMGHVHLDELVARATLLVQQDVVFTHFSARYAPSEVPELVERKLPEMLKGRVRTLM